MSLSMSFVTLSLFSKLTHSASFCSPNFSIINIFTSVQKYLQKGKVWPDYISLSEGRGSRTSFWSSAISSSTTSWSTASMSISLSGSLPPMNSNESKRSGGVYTSLGTRQEGGRFEDVGLSLCASPLQILVLRFRRTEFRQSAEGPKVSGGQR